MLPGRGEHIELARVWSRRKHRREVHVAAAGKVLAEDQRAAQVQALDQAGGRVVDQLEEHPGHPGDLIWQRHA
jgi:hypothetical protein